MAEGEDFNRVVDLVLRWRASPLDFVVECLGAHPTDQQRRILEAFAVDRARVSVCSGHGIGKDTTLSWLGFWGLICFKDVKIAITAPTESQLMDNVWPEFHKWHENMLEPWKSHIVIAKKRVSVQGSLGFITARTAVKEKPEALQGLHAENMFFLIDEASGVPDVIFEVAQSSLSSKNSRVVMMSNPTKLSGYFYDSHHKNRDSWQRFSFSCLDSPNVDRAYVEEIARDYGADSDVYRVRVLGEFPLAGDSQFIPSNLVESAMGKHLQESEFNFAPKVIGVDVAMFGGDRSVVFLRQGLMSKLLFQKRGILPEDLARKVAELEDVYKADAVIVDATGVGEAVLAALRMMNRRPIPFYAGGASKTAGCFNARMEVWFLLREWLKAGGAIPADNDLRDDLVLPEYGYDSQGRLRLEKKEDMRKRGAASPDLGDALAVTFGAPVKCRLTHAANVRNGVVDISDYDPTAF